MSRVGRQPIELPSGVELDVAARTVRVSGPKGKLEHELPVGITVERAGSQVRVQRSSDERMQRALHGLSRSLVANMVVGVSQGFSRSLDLVGTGYRAVKTGGKVVVTVGYSHPVDIPAPAGIEIEVPVVNQVVVRGIDKQLVGQVAADIRAIRRPSAYGEGKGIRYTGERVRVKQGKTGK